ncbi:hypothetical protein [Devosia sp.]|uniref:hypothetical protein n=1 Tax=Devosia sp. TaxID=1871048 RepID=UPI003A93F393
MSKSLYLVINSREAWWVDFEGKAEGPFESRENAALEARDQARYAAHNGRESEVLVPDEDGKYWVIWSSQSDAREGSFTPRRYGAPAHIS